MYYGSKDNLWVPVASYHEASMDHMLVSFKAGFAGISHTHSGFTCVLVIQTLVFMLVLSFSSEPLYPALLPPPPKDDSLAPQYCHYD